MGDLGVEELRSTGAEQDVAGLDIGVDQRASRGEVPIVRAVGDRPEFCVPPDLGGACRRLGWTRERLAVGQGEDVIAVEALHGVVPERAGQRVPFPRRGGVDARQEGGQSGHGVRDVVAARQGVVEADAVAQVFHHQDVVVRIEVMDLGADAVLVVARTRTRTSAPRWPAAPAEPRTRGTSRGGDEPASRSPNADPSVPGPAAWPCAPS